MNWHRFAIIALALWLYIGYIGFLWYLCKAAAKPRPKP